MVPTIIYKNATNWVERGEPAEESVRRSLTYFFERFDATLSDWLAARLIDPDEISAYKDEEDDRNN